MCKLGNIKLHLSPAPHPDLKNLEDLEILKDHEVYSSKKMTSNGVKNFSLLLESDLSAFTKEYDDVSGFSACERTERASLVLSKVCAWYLVSDRVFEFSGVLC